MTELSNVILQNAPVLIACAVVAFFIFGVGRKTGPKGR